ncbi:Ankyrin repeat-containing domain protein [Elaphomyces granulatus]|jgi:ankyrin repeat protein
MPLSELPSEILLNIADQLDDAGANALARTNWQMYGLLNGYLYRRDVMKSRSESRSESRSLTWSVENGAEATVLCAIEACEHLNHIPESFHIALQGAALRGHVHLVELLLRVDGIDPNFESHLQGPPLALAAKGGHSAVVDLLLGVINIDPNARDMQYDTTPLLYACQMGYAPIVRQLLARDDVDLNTIGHEGRATALLLAIFNGHTEIIYVLLNRDDIDVNLYNSRGETPLMMAVQVGLVGVVKSLLARGDLDPDILDIKRDHALLYTVFLGRDIVKSLLDRSNVNLNFVGGISGCTALMFATYSDDVDVMEFLLDQGIDVNAQDSRGMTALGHATGYAQNIQAVKVLLDWRDDTDPNIPDIEGKTPLHWACSWTGHGGLSVLNLLFEKEDVNPNARDIDGLTPLALICISRLNDTSVDFVRSLLSHRDTDPNPVANNGDSALELLLDNQDFEAKGIGKTIESLLRAAGAR